MCVCLVFVAHLLDDFISLEGDCLVPSDTHAELAALRGEICSSIGKKAAEETSTVAGTCWAVCRHHHRQNCSCTVVVDKEIAEKRGIVRTTIWLAPHVQLARVQSIPLQCSAECCINLSNETKTKRKKKVM